MLAFYSLLQRICQFVRGRAKGLANKKYRHAALATTWAFIAVLVAFTSSGFGSEGKNALAAFPQTASREDQIREASEEDGRFTEAKIQVDLTDSRRQGQLFIGGLLEKNVEMLKERQQVAKAEIERLKEEMEQEEEARAQAAREAAAKEEAAAREAARQKAAQEARAAASALVATQKDYQVLLKIVEAEAGNCDEKGRILVANVVLNRIKSKEFPDTVTGVVYQETQFSPVSNGYIQQVKVSPKTIRSVNRALAGEDYSQGALYFMYRKGSTPRAVRWFDSHLSYLFKYGNHEFFK